MLATYKFIFNRKKQRLAKGEAALVQLRVTINRTVRFFSTGIYVEKNQWAGRGTTLPSFSSTSGPSSLESWYERRADALVISYILP